MNAPPVSLLKALAFPAVPEKISNFERQITGIAIGHASISRLFKVFARGRGRCCYCEREVNPHRNAKKQAGTDATIEHLIPVSKGGDDSRENLKLACMRCNNLRGTVSADWFRDFVRNFPGELPEYRSPEFGAVYNYIRMHRAPHGYRLRVRIRVRAPSRFIKCEAAQ